MLLQPLKCSTYCRRINVYQLFFVGFLDTVKVALQSKPLASAIHTGNSAKLRAINGDPFTADESTATCKADQFSPRLRYCIAVQPPELGNAFMVWIQASQKPHQLDISTTLSFQATRRAD